MADYLKLLDTGAGMVGLDDELQLILALKDVATSWQELVEKAKKIEGAESAQALLTAIVANVNDPKLDPLFALVPGARDKLKGLFEKIGALKDKIPEKYWKLLEPLSTYEAGKDGTVDWALDGEKKAQVGSKVKLGVKGSAKLQLDAAAKAKIGETELKPVLRIGVEGGVEANASGELPIQWGKITGSLEASVEVGLDYYYDPPTSTPLYGVAVAERIITLPDPFDFATVWEAFQKYDLAGIVYRFNDKATAKVDVALGLSGSFGDKVLAEAKIGIGASATTDNKFNLALRGLKKEGGIRPVEIVLVRESGHGVGIGVDIGVEVKFDASVVRLREILNQAIAKSDDLIGRITPYLTPGTWLREKFGEEIEAAAKKLIDDPALAGLRDALVADIKSVAGEEEPEESALIAALKDKLTGAIDDGAKQLTDLGESGREAIIDRVTQALPGALGDQLGAALRDKTKDAIGSLVDKAADAFESELTKLVKEPGEAFRDALKKANIAVSKPLNAIDDALEPVRKLIDQYNDLLKKVKEFANDEARTRITAKITLEESWKWGEEEKIVGTFDAPTDAAAKAFEEITRGDVEQLKARLLANIMAKRSGKSEPEPTPGFTLLPASRIKYSAERGSKANLQLVLFGFGMSAEKLLNGKASVLIDGEGKVQADSETSLTKRFKGGNEEREISFVDTYSLQVAKASGPSEDDVRNIEVGIGISHIDKKLERKELVGFVTSLSAAGLVTADTAQLAGARFDAWLAPGKSKLVGDIGAKFALSHAQLRTLMDIDARKAAQGNKLSEDYKKRIVHAAYQASVDAKVQKHVAVKAGAHEVADIPGQELPSVAGYLYERLGDSRAIQSQYDGKEVDAPWAFIYELKRMESIVALIETMGDVYLAEPKIDDASSPGAWSSSKFADAQHRIGDFSSRWLQTGAGSDGVAPATVAFLATICDLLDIERVVDGKAKPEGVDIMELTLSRRSADGASIAEKAPLAQRALPI